MRLVSETWDRTLSRNTSISRRRDSAHFDILRMSMWKILKICATKRKCRTGSKKPTGCSMQLNCKMPKKTHRESPEFSIWPVLACRKVSRSLSIDRAEYETTLIIPTTLIAPSNLRLDPKFIVHAHSLRADFNLERTLQYNWIELPERYWLRQHSTHIINKNRLIITTLICVYLFHIYIFNKIFCIFYWLTLFENCRIDKVYIIMFNRVVTA